MAKTKDFQIPGQMELFSYMEEIKNLIQKEECCKNVIAAGAARKESILGSVQEYLDKGERLTTLARSRYGNMMKALSFTDVQQKLYSINVNGYDLENNLVPKIATNVIRPLLRSLTTYDENDEAIKILKSLIKNDIRISPVDMKGEGWISAVRKLRFKDDGDLIRLTLKEEGWNALTIYGYKDKAHPKSRKRILFKDGSMVGDIAEVLAWMVLINEVYKALDDKELLPQIEEKLMLKEYLKCDVFDILHRYVYDASIEYSHFSRELYNISSVREMIEKAPATYMLPVWKRKRPKDVTIKLFNELMNTDIAPVVTEESSDEFKKSNRKLYEVAGKVKGWVLTSEIDKIMFYADPINAYKAGIKFDFNDFLSVCDRDLSMSQKRDENYMPLVWPQPAYGSMANTWAFTPMETILEVVFENYKEKVKTAEYFKKQGKDRAKVWQTKKNIPEKVVKAAKESILNDYYGYVEFDEDTDLEKVSAIADEFVAFKETYLKSLDTSNVSIRFRKLGNYKAAGLYFFEIACLCVDIHNPDSLVHEYGHCIDTLIGGDSPLSSQSDFYKVYSKYKQRVVSLAHNEDTKKSLKGKYNLDYYLQKTEAFARCMEMYVTRTLGMNNSICKPDSKMGFAYPDDAELMKLIDEYFSVLFASLNGEIEEQLAA